MVIVGIDIAKFTHEATLMDENGQVLGKPFSFQNSFAGFNKLMAAAKTHVDSPDDLVFGMEATGHYWLGLYAHLRNTGSSVHVINPIQTDALRGLYIRQTKNDARDSFVIADLIRIGRYTKTTLSEPDLLALRELCRHRFFFVDMVSDLKRKVITLLDQVFPEYNTFSLTCSAPLPLSYYCNTPHRMKSWRLIRRSFVVSFPPPAGAGFPMIKLLNSGRLPRTLLASCSSLTPWAS
jgi:hypothetical protein